MIHVYVAGPLTKGNVGANIREAARWADELHRAQFVPFVPHTSFFADLLFPRPYESWLTYDFAWITRCEALLRLEGESGGGDREVAFAKEHGVSVFGDGKVETWRAFQLLCRAFPLKGKERVTAGATALASRISRAFSRAAGGLSEAEAAVLRERFGIQCKHSAQSWELRDGFIFCLDCNEVVGKKD